MLCAFVKFSVYGQALSSSYPVDPGSNQSVAAMSLRCNSLWLLVRPSPPSRSSDSKHQEREKRDDDFPERGREVREDLLYAKQLMREKEKEKKLRDNVAKLMSHKQENVGLSSRSVFVIIDPVKMKLGRVTNSVMAIGLTARYFPIYNTCLTSKFQFHPTQVHSASRASWQRPL